MEQVKNNTKKSWRQIKYSTRLKIEVLSRAQCSNQEIANLTGYSKRTIERELQRGKTKVRHLIRDSYSIFAGTKREYKDSWEYSADVAQQDYEIKSTGKGVQIKLGRDYEFCEAVARHIKNGYSPYSTIQLINHEKIEGRPKLQICVKTLYNYISKDYIPGISQLDLPERGRHRKRGYNRVKIALNNIKGRSIEERPPEVAARNTFGHWEMDCVEGGKSGSKEALLVLSERHTRYELIFKLKKKTQKEVKRTLDKLEEKMGIRRFCKIFESITTDNGSEFLNQSELEKSIGKGNRTTVYYCHPYSAYERGTNENINRMIRRFIPKGADISKYSPSQIQKIQDHINSTPRLILEGYPSNIRYAEHAT